MASNFNVKIVFVGDRLYHPQKGTFMAYLILGYSFECKEFQYQGRIVKGLAFEVKTNEKISRRNISNITVELSKDEGFWVRLHQNAKGIKVEPYKSYALVPCKDDPLGQTVEQIEISHKALMKHADCFDNSFNYGPDSEYYIE